MIHTSVRENVGAKYGCEHGDDFNVLCRTCEEIAQLRADDHYPCSWCGVPNNGHSHLYSHQIDNERKLGHSVKLCEGPRGLNWGDLSHWPHLKFRCLVSREPVDPCDSAFMEEISS